MVYHFGSRSDLFGQILDLKPFFEPEKMPPDFLEV